MTIDTIKILHIFGGRVLPHSPGWPGIHYGDQVDLKLKVIFLALPLKRFLLLFAF